MSEIKITLPDGSVREYPKGSSAMDVALSISEGLASAPWIRQSNKRSREESELP